MKPKKAKLVKIRDDFLIVGKNKLKSELQHCNDILNDKK